MDVDIGLRALDLRDDQQMLHESLEGEKQADARLTKLAKGEVNPERLPRNQRCLIFAVFLTAREEPTRDCPNEYRLAAPCQPRWMPSENVVK